MATKGNTSVNKGIPAVKDAFVVIVKTEWNAAIINVPVPGQQFTRVNSTQFELTVALNGGKQYLMLPVNGDWSHKFAVDDNSIASLKAGGTFKYDAPSNFPGPDASGNYKFVVNFINNSYTLTKQ